MSYQGKKNIPRITVSLVLGKSAVGLHTFCGTEHRRNFLKRGGGRRTQLPPPPASPIAKGNRGGGRRNHIEL